MKDPSEDLIRAVMEEVTRRLGSPSSGPIAPTTSAASCGCASGGVGAGAGAGAAACAPGADCRSGAFGVRCESCPESGVCRRDCPDRLAMIEEHGIARIGCSPGIGPVDRRLAAYLDHTLLRPEATRREVVALCEEAHCHGFATVCIQPIWVSVAARALEGSRSRVCTVVGFPHGANRSEVKAYETQLAVAQGAREIDMVIPIGALKDGDLRTVRRHIGAVCRAAIPGIVTKVILETAYLTDDEKVQACRIARDEGAGFVKTSTGFASAGATLDDIRLMRETVGPRMGVKAAGGIRDADAARRMIEAGATRIGASASIKIAAGGAADASSRY